MTRWKRSLKPPRAAFDAVGDARGAAAEPGLLDARMLAPQDVGGERRAERDRENHRQGHRGDDRRRELAVDDAGRAAEEHHRQEYGGKHQRDGDERHLDLLHRDDRRFLDGQLGLLVEDAFDILDHDDGIVDEQADREHEPEQSQRVDREAEDVEHPEGAEQHDRDGNSGDQRGAPALQEDEHDEDDEGHRLGEGLHHLDDGQADEVGRIVGISDVIAGRHRRLDTGHLGLHQLRGRQRVGAGLEVDADARARDGR